MSIVYLCKGGPVCSCLMFGHSRVKGSCVCKLLCKSWSLASRLGGLQVFAAFQEQVEQRGLTLEGLQRLYEQVPSCSAALPVPALQEGSLAACPNSLPACVGRKCRVACYRQNYLPDCWVRSGLLCPPCPRGPHTPPLAPHGQQGYGDLERDYQLLLTAAADKAATALEASATKQQLAAGGQVRPPCLLWPA